MHFEDPYVFTPSACYDFEDISQIVQPKNNHATSLRLLLINNTMNWIHLYKDDEIGIINALATQPTSLIHQMQTSYQLNAIKPLDLTEEEDQIRWKLLLKTLKEQEWKIEEENKQLALDLLHKYRFLFALNNEPWGIYQ